MIQVLILGVFTFAVLLISFILNKQKTIEGLKKGGMMLLNLLPPFITVILLVSVVLFLVPKEWIVSVFGKQSGALGMLIAALIGSVSLIPGFIAYPLGGMLLKNGVGYPVIAIFITTLMMVGIVTLPIEIRFFGVKASILRNILSFAGAIVIGLLAGLFGGFL